MSRNNDVVIIDLDRPRELRFGHKALKKITALFGKDIEEIVEMETFNLDDLEKMFFYGLERDARENNETLTFEMMEDILDAAPDYGYLFEKLMAALNNAFGSITEGNFPQPAAAQAPAQNRAQRRANGTGNKA